MKLSHSRLRGSLAVGWVLAALSPLALAAGSAGPATMNVSLTVAQSCTLGVNDLGFGSTTDSGTPTAEGAVKVKCRVSATPVTVKLSKTSGTMKINPGDASGVAYNLYKPTSSAWGNTNTCQYSTQWDTTLGDQFTPTNSAEQTIAICGKATIDDNTPAGSYADTVQVTVSW